MAVKLFTPDQVLKSFGAYSRWQLFSFFLLSFSIWVPTCLQMLNIVFIGIKPEHRCQIDKSVAHNESELEKFLPVAFDAKTNSTKFLECRQYAGYHPSNLSLYTSPDFEGLNENEQVPCIDGYWNSEGDKISIVTEWDLYCEDEAFVEISQAIFQAAMAVGVMFTSPLADVLGRKYIHIVSSLGMSVCGLALAFAPTPAWFLILRGISGLFREGNVYAGCVLASELFPEEQRTFAVTAHEFGWLIGQICLTTFAYFLREWRTLQIVISAFPLFIVLWFFILTESIPWLMIKGRYNEVEKILERGFKFNGREVPLKLKELHNECEIDEVKKPLTTNPGSDSVEVKTDKFEVCRYLTSVPLVSNQFIACFNFFVTTMIYYGISLNTGNLFEGSRYMNFFVSAMTEIPGTLGPIILLQWQRKLPLMISSFISGVFLVACAFIPEGSPNWVLLTLAMIGKAAISFNFCGMIGVIPELFPTSVRATCVGIVVLFGRLGGIIAPFYYLMSKYIYWLPFLLSGVLALMQGLLIILLPETRHRPLAETLEELESWAIWRKQKKGLTEDSNIEA